jgi:hypothetical protein
VSSKEVVEIVNYLYNKQDAEAIMARIEPCWTTFTDCDTGLTTRQEIYLHEELQKKKKIKYRDFEKIVLDYCLLSHLEYLRGFTLLFREVNLDQNGILKEVHLWVLAKNVSRGNLENRSIG